MSAWPDQNSFGGTIPANPWQPTRKPWEDFQNGQGGAYAPAAIENQANRTGETKSSGNPFADILNHTARFNAAMAPTQDGPSPGYSLDNARSTYNSIPNKNGLDFNTWHKGYYGFGAPDASPNNNDLLRQDHVASPAPGAPAMPPRNPDQSGGWGTQYPAPAPGGPSKPPAAGNPDQGGGWGTQYPPAPGYPAQPPAPGYPSMPPTPAYPSKPPAPYTGPVDSTPPTPYTPPVGAHPTTPEVTYDPGSGQWLTTMSAPTHITHATGATLTDPSTGWNPNGGWAYPGQAQTPWTPPVWDAETNSWSSPQNVPPPTPSPWSTTMSTPQGSIPQGDDGGGGNANTGGGDSAGNPPPTQETPPVNTPPQPGGVPPLGRTRPTPPVTTHNDPLHYDPNGVAWGPNNPPPRPANTEDSEVAARWYAQFNFYDPTLVNVTKADVDAYRTSGYQAPPDLLSRTPGQNNFIAWWQNGKPTPAQTAPPGGGSTAPPSTSWNPNGGWNIPGQPTTPWTPPVWDPATGTWSTPGVTPPPATTAPAPTAPPATPSTTTPGAPPPVAPPQTEPTPTGTTPPDTTGPTEDVQHMLDLYNQTLSKNQPPPIESLLNPMFARQRQNLIGDMNAQAAASGAIHSGGYGENLGTAVATLGGQQSAALADELSKESLAKMEQNTQLTQLATQAGMQKYLSDVNADLTKFQVNTNADLQRWLSDKDNALKKYGIDSNDVLQRYLGKLGIDKANIDAAATVNAAALHAAAAEAAASAQAGADMARTAVTRELGLAGLGVDREKNIGNFILGLLGLGAQNMFDLNNILSGIPGGSIVVKP